MSNNNAVLDTVIGCGKFQFLVCLACQWVIFAQAWNLLAIVFNKLQPEWTCSDNDTSALALENVSASKFSRCAIKSSCKNLTYSYDYYSLTAEWELVCDRQHIIYLIMTIQMAGVLAGAPIFGQLSDSFGRKWTLLVDVLGIMIFGSISAASPSWQFYAACVFAVGFFCGGSIPTTSVLMMELLSQKHRLWVSTLGGWGTAMALLPLLAYLSKDWRMLLVVANVLSIPAIGLLLLVGESPRWLIAAGRMDEAVARLQRVSAINRFTINEHQWNAVMNLKQQRAGSSGHGATAGKKYSYWHLFSTKRMALHTIVLSITFFCVSSVSFGFTFGLDRLSGSVYLNFLFLSLMRWAGGIVAIAVDYLIGGFGRKIGVVIPAVIISTASSVVVILSLAAPTLPALPTITRFLMLASAVLCSSVWICMGLATSELFATPVRSMSMAFTSIFSRLATVILPQILYLTLFWKPALYIVFALFAFICALLFALFIPETKGQPLPQTMPDKGSNRRGSVIEQRQFVASCPAMKANEMQTPLAVEPSEV